MGKRACKDLFYKHDNLSLDPCYHAESSVTVHTCGYGTRRISRLARLAQNQQTPGSHSIHMDILTAIELPFELNSQEFWPNKGFALCSVILSKFGK